MIYIFCMIFELLHESTRVRFTQRTLIDFGFLVLRVKTKKEENYSFDYPYRMWYTD